MDALAAMPAKRRIVVAGEMLELGAAGPSRCIASAGSYIAEKKIDFSSEYAAWRSRWWRPR